MRLFWLTLLIVLLPVCAFAENVGCMVYNNGLIFTEEQLQRLEKANEVQYVGVQMTGPGRDVREVASRLAKSGKKLIVQIWWGPESPKSWSKYSMANIAQDARIREDFFRDVVDPIIDSIGPENIHTVHLLEETAGQFATDALVPGNPYDYSDDREGGYSSPYYTGYSGNDTYGGPWILSLRRHNADFRRFSGYDLFQASLWVGPEWGGFRKWVGRRVQALANNRFAQHIQKKYPNILATTWDGPDFGGVHMADTPAMLSDIDGFTVNSYMPPLQNYIYARNVRALDFDKSLQFMSWVGRDNLDLNDRRAMLASIYAAGSNIIHLWEEPARAYARDDLWAIMQKMYGTFSSLPVFRHKSDVFVVCSRWDVPSYFLKSFDCSHHEDAEGFGLGRYKLVLLDGAGHPGLQDWLAEGGVAAAFNLRPSFLSDAQVSEGRRVEQSGFSAMSVDFGKGVILLLERGKTDPEDPAWQLFIYDRLKQLADSCGLQAVFEKHFAPRESGGHYFEITSDDGSATCYLHYRVGQSSPPVQVKGTDVLSGDKDPVLGPKRSAAIVAHAPLQPWSPPPPPDRSKYARSAEPGARRGQPHLPELPPDDPLGPAKTALAPVKPPVLAEAKKYTDWAAPSCRYRVVLRFEPALADVVNQPMVLTGKQLFELSGMNDLKWGSVRVFSGRKETPVQIDERDGSGQYFAKGNGKLDADDEMVFGVSVPKASVSTYHIYFDSKSSNAKTWPAANVTFQTISTDIADAVLSNGRLSAQIKGPAKVTPASDISNYGAGAITECSLDGKSFTRIRQDWGNYFFVNHWSSDPNWSKPELVKQGPVRSIVQVSLPQFVEKNQAGQTILRGSVTNYYSMYGDGPVLDIEQRIQYPFSDRRWRGQWVFYTTVGSAPDANDLLLVPVAGKPTRARMQDVGDYGNRYLEHRPEQGWMAVLDPVEKHGCAVFYATMDEVRENLAWVDYSPARELTPSAVRYPYGYPLRLDYTNRVMQSDIKLVRRFRLVGLTDEDEFEVSARYKVWGEGPLRLGGIESHTRR